MPKYLIPFLEAFFLTVGMILVFLPLARRIQWSRRSSVRHIHQGRVYRIGGVAMVLAFNLAVLINPDLVITPELFGFMLASLILMLVGVRDDMRELFWKTQLFFQIAVSVLIFILGVRIYYVTNPFGSGTLDLDLGSTVLVALLLVVFWIVFVINAINWVDGVDGLSGGISLISVGTILLLSFKPEVNQPPVAIICSILAGAITGFLIFNLNPARVMAGTSGAMFMGLSLAVLAIFSGTKIATATLVLTVPLVDFVWVIGERLRDGRSIFGADNNHLHHKLLEIGWSQRKIALSYYLVTLAVAALALNTRMVGKGVVLTLSALIMLAVSFMASRKLAKLREKRI